MSEQFQHRTVRLLTINRLKSSKSRDRDRMAGEQRVARSEDKRGAFLTKCQGCVKQFLEDRSTVFRTLYFHCQRTVLGIRDFWMNFKVGLHCHLTIMHEVSDVRPVLPLCCKHTPVSVLHRPYLGRVRQS